jgi:hypothetical protein
MLEPGQPVSYSVLVPASQAAAAQSLLSLRSGGNYFDGYDVRQVGANCIQFTRRYTPQWAVVVAIVGSCLFLLGALALLVRETEVLTINVYQRDEGSYLSVSGRAAPAVAAAVNLVISRLISGVTTAWPAGTLPARPPWAIPAGPLAAIPPRTAPLSGQGGYQRGHLGQPGMPFSGICGIDQSGRELLLRARRARETVLASRVYAENLLEHAADEMALRHHEQEIAILLQDIAKLRAQLPRGQSAGPMTSAVLDPQQRILTQAQESAESRVRAMERYAAQVKAADAARLDWENAVRLSGLNDSFLDLAARTAADEHAIGELKNLTEHAAIAAEALRHSLRQATVAADALVLPPHGQG